MHLSTDRALFLLLPLISQLGECSLLLVVSRLLLYYEYVQKCIFVVLLLFLHWFIYLLQFSKEFFVSKRVANRDKWHFKQIVLSMACGKELIEMSRVQTDQNKMHLLKVKSLLTVEVVINYWLKILNCSPGSQKEALKRSERTCVSKTSPNINSTWIQICRRRRSNYTNVF